MASSICIQLDPASLENPDADLRYVLPERIVARSGGTISDEGFDYTDEGDKLQLFLEAEDSDAAIALVAETLSSERILGNDLRAGTLVALKGPDGYRVVVPPGDGAVLNVST